MVLNKNKVKNQTSCNWINNLCIVVVAFGCLLYTLVFFPFLFVFFSYHLSFCICQLFRSKFDKDNAGGEKVKKKIATMKIFIKTHFFVKILFGCFYEKLNAYFCFNIFLFDFKGFLEASFLMRGFFFGLYL